MEIRRKHGKTQIDDDLDEFLKRKNTNNEKNNNFNIANNNLQYQMINNSLINYCWMMQNQLLMQQNQNNVVNNENNEKNKSDSEEGEIKENYQKNKENNENNKNNEELLQKLIDEIKKQKNISNEVRQTDPRKKSK